MIITAPPSSRDPLRPLGNGKLVELGKWVVGMFFTALVAYFTALGAIDQRVTRVETKEAAHFDEVLRTLTEIKAELVRLRTGK